MADSIAVSEKTDSGPRQFDLDKCVHCGLCLNACPTYRELGLEMDSPRGRVYQMVQVANGAPITDSYREHIDLCLACRGCESACPSGVPYGRMVEDARAEMKPHAARVAGFPPRCATSSSSTCCNRAAPSPSPEPCSTSSRSAASRPWPAAWDN